jgi:hypothetical protein
MSLLRLATGFAEGQPFAVIDTEARRALHYADQFKFDHTDFAPPFSPERYLETIVAAEAAGYPVIVVDSFTHEWAGEGGCCEMQEAELDRMGGDDLRKREQVKIAAWVKPKIAHRRLVSKLLQLRAHVLFGLRAEPKIEMLRVDGKMVVQPKRVMGWLSEWIPVTEKSFMFEMTASFVLSPDYPGVPIPMKLQEQHKAFFPLDQPISEVSGQGLAEWAKGAVPVAPVEPTPEGERFPHRPYPDPPPTYNIVTGELTGPDGKVITTRTPVDDWEDELNNVKTNPQRMACFERIKTNWGSLLGPEQKRLVDANARAKQRVGG